MAALLPLLECFSLVAIPDQNLICSGSDLGMLHAQVGYAVTSIILAARPSEVEKLVMLLPAPQKYAKYRPVRLVLSFGPSVYLLWGSR